MTLLIGQACWDARLIQAMKITALVTFLHNGANRAEIWNKNQCTVFPVHPIFV